MRKNLSLILIIVIILSSLLTACSESVEVDFSNVDDFEAALNEGEDLTGKVVTFTINKLVPNSAFGYNLQTGEHLNFCSATNPGAKGGETITVKVTEIKSVLGSYIISYEKVKWILLLKVWF